MAPPRKTETESPTTEPAAPSAPRLSLQLTEDGKRIAFDRMRPQTREQLRTVFNDSTFQKEFDLAPAQGGTADASIDSASLAGVLYGGLSTIMVGLAQRSGYTREQAAVLGFTGAEVEQLAPITGKVLDKYLPSGKYQDELLLGLMLTTVISGKLALLKKSAAVVHMVPPTPSRAAQEAVESQAGNQPNL